MTEPKKQLPPHIRTMSAMMDALPKPEKDGIVVTLVGYGFGGDVISEGEEWIVQVGFKVRARFP